MVLFNTEELYEIATSFFGIIIAIIVIKYGGIAGLGKMTLSTLAKDFLVITITLGIAFIFHEMAHKFVAMQYGFDAKFKAFNIGIAIMLIMALFPIGFLILAPGAVMINQITNKTISKRTLGIIALAGPLMNILLAFFFLIVINSQLPFLLPYLLGFGTAQEYIDIFVFSVRVNSLLALFNLLPFFIFDGAKIINWDGGVWIVVTLIALALYIL